MALTPRDADRSALTKVKLKGPNVTEYTIKDLDVFTQYLVRLVVSTLEVPVTPCLSLEVENPEGAGPATTVVVMTDEGGEEGGTDC